jgi:hypothetical protein
MPTSIHEDFCMEMPYKGLKRLASGVPAGVALVTRIAALSGSQIQKPPALPGCDGYCLRNRNGLDAAACRTRFAVVTRFASGSRRPPRHTQPTRALSSPSAFDGTRCLFTRRSEKKPLTSRGVPPRRGTSKISCRTKVVPSVELLNAAELHGATHQAVMEFQVVTRGGLSLTRPGRLANRH